MNFFRSLKKCSIFKFVSSTNMMNISEKQLKYVMFLTKYCLNWKSAVLFLSNIQFSNNFFCRTIYLEAIFTSPSLSLTETVENEQTPFFPQYFVQLQHLKHFFAKSSSEKVIICIWLNLDLSNRKKKKIEASNGMECTPLHRMNFKTETVSAVISIKSPNISSHWADGLFGKFFFFGWERLLMIDGCEEPQTHLTKRCFFFLFLIESWKKQFSGYYFKTASQIRLSENREKSLTEKHRKFCSFRQCRDLSMCWLVPIQILK